ncbi:MAG: tripartite tricarboxylate transporter TctB family protein [Pseudomonadota bacterium]
MTRLGQILPPAVIAAVGAWVAWISYTQQPADAFLFPRLISTVFVLLALWALGQAILGRARVEAGISWKALSNLAPGFLVLLVYVFWAAKSLGFYTATAIGFFLLLSLYDPGDHRAPRVWARRLAITAVFTLVMYGLFAQLLNVFTPREVLF